MQQQRTTLRPIDPLPHIIMFDLDDTLCDYAGARLVRLRKAFTIALETAGNPPEIDFDNLIAESLAIHPHGTDHFGELLASYGIEDSAAVEAAKNWYRQNRFHQLALFEDALKTLASIRSLPSTRTIGLITNGPTEVQRAKIDMFSLEALVDFILVSEEFGAAKPDPTIFAEALRLSEGYPDDSVFIGDSPEHDIVGARAAGIRSIWVNRTGKPWSVEHPPPDYEARNLADVRALLGVREDSDRN
jgi:putative hydrolase of the HAD superfamily